MCRTTFPSKFQGSDVSVSPAPWSTEPSLHCSRPILIPGSLYRGTIPSRGPEFTSFPELISVNAALRPTLSSPLHESSWPWIMHFSVPGCVVLWLPSLTYQNVRCDSASRTPCPEAKNHTIQNQRAKNFCKFLTKSIPVSCKTGLERTAFFTLYS